MSAPKHLTWLALALAAGAGAAQAQERERATERLELTMKLLPPQARDAGEITRRIELPPPPAAEPGEANGQRPEELPGAENGRGKGLENAAEARERGRAFGQDVAAEARENRENAGRGNDSPGPPADRPSPPGNPNRP